MQTCEDHCYPDHEHGHVHEHEAFFRKSAFDRTWTVLPVDQPPQCEQGEEPQHQQAGSDLDACQVFHGLRPGQRLVENGLSSSGIPSSSNLRPSWMNSPMPRSLLPAGAVCSICGWPNSFSGSQVAACGNAQSRLSPRICRKTNGMAPAQISEVETLGGAMPLM